MEIRRLTTSFSDVSIVVNYLRVVDHDFTPSLSSKVDIEQFIDKVSSLGFLYGAFDNNEIIGLICFYCNDIDFKCSYCSLLSVKKEYRSKGIAKQLMQRFIEDSKDNGMEYATIHTNNLQAFDYYKKTGFICINVEVFCGTDRYFLRKKL